VGDTLLRYYALEIRMTDGRKIEPLMIRDLHSRGALLVRHQAKKNCPAARDDARLPALQGTRR
jgi:hypothetical protein